MEVALIGFGGNAKVVIDACDCNNQFTIVGYFDDKVSNSKIKYLGTIADVSKSGVKNLIITIGDLRTRDKIYRELSDFAFPNIIHRNAYCSPSVKLGIGNIIYNGAIINSSTVIGDFNLINTSSIIEHDSVIGSFNNINPRVTVCGTCRIGDRNFIGAASTIRNNMVIGSDNLIGCASNVVSNIGDGVKGFGNPFKMVDNN